MSSPPASATSALPPKPPTAATTQTPAPTPGTTAPTAASSIPAAPNAKPTPPVKMPAPPPAASTATATASRPAATNKPSPPGEAKHGATPQPPSKPAKPAKPPKATTSVPQAKLPLPRPTKRPRAASDSSDTPKPSSSSSLFSVGPPPSSSNNLSRELHLLTGGQTPAPLVPAFPLTARPRRKVSWLHTPFSNPARSDRLQLSHWARAGTPSEYPFHKFARRVRLLTYSDHEYRSIISHDPLSITDAAAAAEIAAEAAAAAAAAQASSSDPGSADDAANANGSMSAKQTLSAASGPAAVAAAATAAAAAAPPVDNPGPPPKEPRTSVPTLRRRAASPPATAAANTSPSAPAAKATTLTAAKQRAKAVNGGNLRQGIHEVPKQKGWTRGETDKLFEMCEQFDLRFIIVHDRWPSSLRPRSIDELKGRYYSLAKLLLEAWSGTEENHLAKQPMGLQKHAQAITMNPFDYEYECIRKNQLEWHYARSKAELREEEETVREARRIEATRKRVAKERQRLARLLTPAALPSGKAADASVNAGPTVTPQKTFPHRKVTSGAFARSTMVYAPISQSQKVSKRIDSALNELGVPLRPTPTTTVVDIFDLLRMEILAFMELQKTVTKKEEEVHALRVRLAKLKGEPAPAPPPGVLQSHKKRRADDADVGSLFGPAQTQQKS